MSTGPLHQPELLGVWLALSIIVATMVGVGAGVLCSMSGTVLPESVLRGGAAFGATLMLAAVLLQLLRSRS